MMLSHGLLAGGPKDFKLIIYIGTNADVRAAAIAAGWNGDYKVMAEVAPGIARAGIYIAGSFPRGIDLLIPAGSALAGLGGTGGGVQSMSGFGAGGSNNGTGNDGQSGGIGLSVYLTPVRVTNLGTIAAGGGGGGGGAAAWSPTWTQLYSGRGGDGATWPGGPGSFSGGTSGSGSTNSGNGGAGGNPGSAGSAGNGSKSWGNPDFEYFNGGRGGAAGYAVSGNSNVTWLATGTRIGPIA